ncbi:MAG: hypothetical protein ACKN89_15285 [Cyanobium sp.]
MEGSIELLNSRNDRKIFAEGLGVILDRAEITFNLIGFRGTNAGELVENSTAEVDLTAAVAKQCREQRGESAGQQEHQDQLRLDAELVQGALGEGTDLLQRPGRK